MDKNVILSPSILTANFACLKNDIELINRSRADWFHLDVMDGVFVPNISFGFPVMAELAKFATKPLDVHLMIVDPLKFVKEIKAIGAHVMNVHYEACTHLHRNVQQIKNEGMKAGVTLNPHTPVSVLEEIVPELDLVLLMSVNPGFGGQKFIENTLDKTRRLKELILKRNSNAIIQIDGGVNYTTGKQLLDAGADSLVVGSFVFQSDNPLETISNLKDLSL